MYNEIAENAISYIDGLPFSQEWQPVFVSRIYFYRITGMYRRKYD